MNQTQGFTNNHTHAPEFPFLLLGPVLQVPLVFPRQQKSHLFDLFLCQCAKCDTETNADKTYTEYCVGLTGRPGAPTAPRCPVVPI